MTGPLARMTAIVTGAGRGIGRALALALASEGVNIVAAARTSAEVAQVADEAVRRGVGALPVTADLTKEADITAMISAAAEKFGRIDILVNNAGIGHFAPVRDMQTAHFDAMWSVNMRGLFLTTRAVLPFMERQNSGDIVNIASLAGRNAFTGGAGYAATKWALIGFSRCLMLEVREKNIRVITLCPGSVDTTFGGAAASSLKSWGSIPGAGDIATVAVNTLRMPRHVMVSEVDIRPTNPKG